jgi:hypothetical protein
MACRSDYQQDYPSEIEASKVLALLDELKTNRHPDPEDYGRTTGNYRTHGVYGNEKTDQITAELCAKLQNVDVTKYSLEMQIWWRDHKAADTKRLRDEIKRITTESEKQAAIAKLTPHERKLLGL